MDCQSGIALSDLLLIDQIEIPLSLQNEQKFLPPVVFQTASNFLPGCMNPCMGQRMKEPYEEGVAIHSAPSFAPCAAKRLVKRKQGHRWAGY
jgi:hypothetical protein